MMELLVTVCSPLCLASSVGAAAGDVDSETESAHGIPLLRGRTLKGLLVEEVANILNHLERAPGPWRRAADQLFGIPGNDKPGVLAFSDGFVGAPQGTDERELFEALTLVKKQTRIDGETGAAEDGSLRSTRLVRSGLTFKNRIAFSAALDGYGCGLLAAATKALRRAGLNRNRGWGEISAKLLYQGQDVTDRWLAYLKNPGTATVCESAQIKSESSQPKLANRLSFTIKLQEPVVLAQSGHDPSTVETHSFIPGSSILGCAASRWLARNPVPDPAGHPEFRKLFLDGTVRWGPAYPSRYQVRYLPIPNSLFTEKGKDDSYFDLCEADPEPNWKQRSGEFVLFNEGEIQVLAPQKSLRLHHQRDRDKGRADEDEGALFSYESLSAGQEFQTEVYLDQPELASTVSELLTSGTLRLGRSRSAGYGGGALATLNRVEPDELDLEQKHLVVTLISDYLGVDEFGAVQPKALEEELRRELGLEAAVQKFLKFRKTCGYVAAWRMPRPSQTVVAAGSVLKFKCPEGLDSDKVEQLLHHGLGARRTDGFGRFAVNLHGSRKAYSKKRAALASGRATESFEDGGVAAEMVAMSVARKRLREHALKVVLDRIPSPSLLGRIRSKIRGIGREDLRPFLISLERRVKDRRTQEEVERKGKPADEALQRAVIDGSSLKDWLHRWTQAPAQWPLPPKLLAGIPESRQWQMARLYLDLILERARREARR